MRRRGDQVTITGSLSHSQNVYSHCHLEAIIDVKPYKTGLLLSDPGKKVRTALATCDVWASNEQVRAKHSRRRRSEEIKRYEAKSVPRLFFNMCARTRIK